MLKTTSTVDFVVRCPSDFNRLYTILKYLNHYKRDLSKQGCVFLSFKMLKGRMRICNNEVTHILDLSTFYSLMLHFTVYFVLGENTR